MLRVAVSSRALFHIEDGDQIFQDQGQEAFDDYMRNKEEVPLRQGTTFSTIRKLLALNVPGQPQLVDVVMLSRNSPDAGMRIMNSIVHYGLNIKSATFSKGMDRFRFAKEMEVHLFLSANAADVQYAIANGIAAATMLPSEREDNPEDVELRIGFDGDSVLFSDEADKCYQAHGLEFFCESESKNAKLPLGAGPFKRVLEELQIVQQAFKGRTCPLRVGLITARSIPAHGRVLNTLRSWGITLDLAVFANGAPKGPLLKAYGADIFFDDTQKNISSADGCNIPSGHVPFGTGQGITAPALMN